MERNFEYKKHTSQSYKAYVVLGIGFIAISIIISLSLDPNNLTFEDKAVSFLSFICGIAALLFIIPVKSVESKCFIKFDENKITGIIPAGLFSSETINVNYKDITEVNAVGFFPENPTFEQRMQSKRRQKVSPKIFLYTHNNCITIRSSSTKLLRNIFDCCSEVLNVNCSMNY